MKNLYENVGTFTPDNLINGNGVQILFKSVKIKKGSSYKRGQLLGIVTTTGYAVPVKADQSDGSQIADCILCDDVDTKEDEYCTAYITGEFNRKAIVLEKGQTIDKFENRLRELGIYLKDNK